MVFYFLFYFDLPATSLPSSSPSSPYHPQVINVRVNIGCSIGRDQLFNYCIDQGIDLPIARKALHMLIRRLVFEESENGKVKRIS